MTFYTFTKIRSADYAHRPTPIKLNFHRYLSIDGPREYMHQVGSARVSVLHVLTQTRAADETAGPITRLCAFRREKTNCFATIQSAIPQHRNPSDSVLTKFKAGALRISGVHTLKFIPNYAATLELNSYHRMGALEITAQTELSCEHPRTRSTYQS